MLVSLAQMERLLSLRGTVVGRKDFVSIAEARDIWLEIARSAQPRLPVRPEKLSRLLLLLRSQKNSLQL
jgi:hypothetical protein